MKTTISERMAKIYNALIKSHTINSCTLEYNKTLEEHYIKMEIINLSKNDIEILNQYSDYWNIYAIDYYIELRIY